RSSACAARRHRRGSTCAGDQSQPRRASTRAQGAPDFAVPVQGMQGQRHAQVTIPTHDPPTEGSSPMFSPATFIRTAIALAMVFPLVAQAQNIGRVKMTD